MVVHSINQIPELEAVRSTLIRWAAHIAHTEEAQVALVDRTIAAACEDPFYLAESRNIEHSLMSLMLDIARTSELATLTARPEGNAVGKSTL
jgi:hypothetical protein